MKALTNWALKEKLGIEKACEKPNIHISFSHELLFEKLFYPSGWKIDSMTFKYRRKITITEQSGSDLTNYQVLIELNSTNFDFTHAQINGEDIRFTDASGNLLNYWIEEWDAVSETAKVWVKVPSIPANSSVEIQMYYGNPEVASESDAVATFIRVIDGVVGSWHFDEGSGTTAYDTSGNDNDGTINGATWVDGKFGRALDFDGVDDYVEIPDDSSLDITEAITIEAWVYDPPTINKESKNIISKTLNDLEKLRIKQIKPDKFILKTLSNELIEIGEERYLLPQPYLKLNKWDEEVFLKVRIPYGQDAKRFLEQNKLKYITHKYKIEIYPKEPKEITKEIHGKRYLFKINEEGGVEFDIFLKEKPSSNIFEFPIEAKGLRFYYQPPLTEEIKVGDRNGKIVKVTETDAYIKDEKTGELISVTHRPEWVIGSYAVYHKDKSGDYSKMRGKNYKTGKAFHIYRPKIIDAKGDWVWGELHFDEKREILLIKIPQEFLDKAVYPVRIDPNFGYESKGASYTYLYDDIAGSWFTCPEDGTADSITAYHDDWGAGNEYAIYKKSDNSLVGHTESGTGQKSEGWYTFNFLDPKPSLSGGEDYWLVLWGTANTYYWYDSATGKGGRQDDVSKWPDPWSPTSEDKIYSIYCTYTSAPTIIVGKGRDAYQIEIDDDLNVIGYINNQIVSTQITKEWHHIVLTYDKTNIKLYVDNIEKDSIAYSSTISTNTKSLKIGKNVQGTIDEVRIYNRALSEEEIQDLYNYYGYNTENYPGKTLVRKRVNPEPSVSIGTEETP